MAVIHISGDPDITTLNAALSHRDTGWALGYPHDAMQVHIECRVGECVAKTVAHRKLQELGKLVPDSRRGR